MSTYATIDPENNFGANDSPIFLPNFLSLSLEVPCVPTQRHTCSSDVQVEQWHLLPPPQLMLDAAAAAVGDSAAAVIGLNSWIDAALRSLKTADSDSNSNCSHQHHKVVSDEYLTCALKIAHCLVEQLCVVDVEGDEFTAGGGERQHEAAIVDTVHFCTVWEGKSII